MGEEAAPGAKAGVSASNPAAASYQLRLGADYVILLGLSFSICGLGLYHPHPGLLGKEVRGPEAWAVLHARHTGLRMACFSSALSKTNPCHYPGRDTEGHMGPMHPGCPWGPVLSWGGSSPC